MTIPALKFHIAKSIEHKPTPRPCTRHDESLWPKAVVGTGTLLETHMDSSFLAAVINAVKIAFEGIARTHFPI